MLHCGPSKAMNSCWQCTDDFNFVTEMLPVLRGTTSQAWIGDGKPEEALYPVDWTRNWRKQFGAYQFCLRCETCRYSRAKFRTKGIKTHWKNSFTIFGPIPWTIEVLVVMSAVIQRWPDFTTILTLLIVNTIVGNPGVHLLIARGYLSTQVPL